MKIFNFICFVLFILCAGLQYNDSDPYIWVPIYLYGAWLCFAYFRGRYYPKAYWFGIVAYISYALILFFDRSGVIVWYRDHGAENIASSMKASKPWIEETREFGGLMILVVVLMIDYFGYRNSAKQPIK